MDNNFFSLCRSADWDSGTSDNLIFDKSGIRICSANRYVNQSTIFLENLTPDRIITHVAVADAGMIYFADSSMTICAYDSLSHVSSTLIRLSCNSISFMDWGNSKLYVCSDAGEIYAINTETGAIEEKIEADIESGTVKAVHADSIGFLYLLYSSGTIRCINKNLNIDETWRSVIKTASGEMLLKGYSGRYIYTYDVLNGVLSQIDLIEGNVSDLSLAGCVCMGIHKRDIIMVREEHGLYAVWEVAPNAYKKRLFICEDKPDIVEFEGKSQVYLLSLSQNELTIMKREPGISINSGEKSYMGTHYSRVFDAVNEEMLWDKMCVWSDVPEGCMYSVSYCAFNDYEMNVSGVRTTFREYLSSIKDVHKLDEYMDSRWQGEIFNFKRALFREAKGRYLLLRIRLWGSSTSTPSINRLRVYFGRNTYTRYLPEIFSQGSESFLDRYLSMAEVLMLDMEEKIDNISDNFDPDRAPAEMLKWLCSWMDLEVDYTWSDDKIRKLIKKAPLIFKYRGTKRAIEEMLSVYLGSEPVIIEDFKLNDMRAIVGLRDTVNSLYGENPYGYTVLVKLDKELKGDEKIAVKKILDSESPAYCTYQFIELEPWIALSKHTYLGINSQIMDYSNLRLDNKSVLPYNAVL